MYLGEAKHKYKKYRLPWMKNWAIEIKDIEFNGVYAPGLVMEDGSLHPLSAEDICSGHWQSEDTEKDNKILVLERQLEEANEKLDSIRLLFDDE